MSKILTFVLMAATIIIVGLWWASGPGAKHAFSHDEYQVSDELLDPSQIASNPYLLQGHSGILGGYLRFERMIDEHTATYEVVAPGGGEIAVKLTDSNPPDPFRRWRVFVERPEEGTNVFGAPIKISAVSFEGYYIPEGVTPTRLRSRVTVT
jgi:hypothetical protein